MTEDTWNTRDLLVLQAVVDIYEDSGTYLTRAIAIERRTGVDHDTVQRALQVLDGRDSADLADGSRRVGRRPKPGYIRTTAIAARSSTHTSA